ncbi:hypothetical protein GGP88_002262 [Salinibacter ruber]|nr:hypothetical protein [Salinibacter ruber]
MVRIAILQDFLGPRLCTSPALSQLNIYPQNSF